MKEMMCCLKSFITFDSPLQADFINAKFISIHNSQKNKFLLWSTNSTRIKMVFEYWFNQVLKHFLSLFTAAILLILFKTHPFSISSILPGGLISFWVMYFFNYRPLYLSIFLPHLEAVKEDYELKVKGELNKCKHLQLSNFALVLVFYVLAQTSNMNLKSCNDNFATLLSKLYGVDAGSIKKNLELLFIPRKRMNLSDRKITELKNRFEEAYNFFEELESVQSLSMLKELETKFFLCEKSLTSK